jgi:hypothetical protein
MRSTILRTLCVGIAPGWFRRKTDALRRLGALIGIGMKGNWKANNATYLFFARPKTGDLGLNPDHGLRSIKITIAA